MEALVPSRSKLESTDAIDCFRSVRRASERFCEPLEVEDFGVQSMADASPLKWHLAHTTWFFETFLLKPHLPGYGPFHAQFGYLFNSYYNALGAQWRRADRSLIVRPTVADVFRYRAFVDEHMVELLRKGMAPIGIGPQS
jgi:hypothetical protein